MAAVTEVVFLSGRFVSVIAAELAVVPDDEPTVPLASAASLPTVPEPPPQPAINAAHSALIKPPCACNSFANNFLQSMCLCPLVLSMAEPDRQNAICSVACF